MLAESVTISAHKGGVLALAMNSDGQYCLSGGEDRRIVLWNPRREDQTPIKEYTGHSNRVLDISVAPDNRSFASCGGDRAVFLWDVPSGRVTRRLQGHTQRVNSVAYNDDASVLVSGSYDTSVRCWDCRSRNISPVQVMSESADSISSVAVREHEIFSASVDGTVRCYDLRKGSVTSDVVGVPVTHLCLSRDGHCVLIAGLDSRLRLMDKATGQALNEYTGHVNESTKIPCSLSFDDARVVSGSEDGSLHVWDLVEAKTIQRCAAHRGALTALACSPHNAEVLTGAYDGTIKLWAPTSGPAMPKTIG
uniref:Anaphase-promoting complex subunit 4 WD40 domain-containing protein n=1 Tax=Chrysotila carterae TaxID=13221 RepID=A0A7S4FAZ6_CHRCT